MEWKSICVFAILLVLSTIGATQDGSEPLTPVPFIDINKDLRPLYLGKESDYFVSNYATDARTARMICQNLTTLTGKHFNLLTLESQDELKELESYLTSLNVSGLWLSGEKTFDSDGEVSVVWVTEDGPIPMSYRNFRQGTVRRRRDLMELALNMGTVAQNSKRSEVSSSEVEVEEEEDKAVLYPWLSVNKEDKGSGRCRNAKWVPEDCKPVECNVTVPECTTITPPCTVDSLEGCSIQRGNCSAKCENCTVSKPVCYAQPQPCETITPECQTTRPPCSVERPPCVTEKPKCETFQPSCQVPSPPPCLTTQPPCIPTFQKDNCTSVGNQTICEPSYKCPPPEVCQSPPIVCPPPITYCEPGQTVCPDPIVTCPKPTIYCPNPIVHCPEPKIVCTQPSVVCSPPVVNCPEIVTSCPRPQLNCPEPIVTCPPPKVECSEPEPCVPPTLPPTCEESTTSTTTEKPCQGCGCIFMNKRHQFQWDIDVTCRRELHFICEG